MFQPFGALKRALLSCVVVAAAAVGGFYGYDRFQQRREEAIPETAPPPRALLSVTYHDADGQHALPPALLPAFELILDSSYSMSGGADDRPKYRIAQQVTKDLLSALPDTAQVGLRLYGHWGVWLPRRDNPQAEALASDDPRLDEDSELVVSLGALSAQRRRQLNHWIDWATPQGKTPLVYSLREARRDFPATWRGPKTIILVTDGYETCGGRLEDVAADYGDPASGIVVHVVGFAVEGSDEHRQLAEIARIAGGRYFRADGAAELAAALRQAVRSAAFVVFDSAGETVVARGLINGAPLQLPAGSYGVAIQGYERQAVKVEVEEGAMLALLLDEGGKLSIDSQRFR
jgi:hypothetical protein